MLNKEDLKNILKLLDRAPQQGFQNAAQTAEYVGLVQRVAQEINSMPDINDDKSDKNE